MTDAEYDEIEAAARASGLSVSAWCAQAALSVLDRRIVAPGGLERRLLVELTQTRTQAIKIGTNLNQAVHKLNETGEDPGDLAVLAAAAGGVVSDLLEVAESAAARFGVTR